MTSHLNARVTTYIENLHPKLFYDSYYDILVEECPKFSFLAEIHHEVIIDTVINSFLGRHRQDQDQYVESTIKCFAEDMHPESLTDDEYIKALEEFVRTHLCAVNYFFDMCTDFDIMEDGLHSQQLRDSSCTMALSYRRIYEEYGEEAML